MDIPFLSGLIAIPLVVALLISFIPKTNSQLIKGLSGAAAVVSFAASLVLWDAFNPVEGMQFTEKYAWIPTWNIYFELGIDGVSLLMIVLTTLMSLVVLLYIFSRGEHIKPMAIGLLIMQGSLVGVFAAIDLAVFYLFFELMLIPTWLLMGLYGTSDSKVTNRAAAIKFFVYTLVGGFSMLAGVIYLGVSYGSTSLVALGRIDLDPQAQIILFVAFLLSFGIKLPVFPFHTWQADAYSTAPVAVTVMLTAVMAKIGAYGLFRLNVVVLSYGALTFATGIMVLAVIGILYGAIISAIQDDLKRLLAYSSLAHLGFVTLGLFTKSPIAMGGSIVQMFNHGITTGALFILVGILADRTGTTSIKQFGGLLTVNPLFGGLFIFSAMSSVALPGLNGFVGEFPILLGSFQRYPVQTAFATIGVVLAAVYLLWAIERAFMRSTSETSKKMSGGLQPLELAILLPLMALMLIIGLYPKPVYDVVDPTINQTFANHAIVTKLRGN